MNDHDAFGRLLTDPRRLPHADRIKAYRAAAGALLDDRRIEVRAIGEALRDRLAHGGNLDGLLGLRPPRGSRLTPERRLAFERQRALMRRLIVAAGSASCAAAVLRGERPAPAGAADIAADLRACGAPTSASSFERAAHQR